MDSDGKKTDFLDVKYGELWGEAIFFSWLSCEMKNISSKKTRIITSSGIDIYFTVFNKNIFF